MAAMTAVRIDGGQSMNAFTDVAPGSFQLELAGAFGTTLANPIKFNRFARPRAGARVELVGAGDALG